MTNQASKKGLGYYNAVHCELTWLRHKHRALVNKLVMFPQSNYSRTELVLSAVLVQQSVLSRLPE